MCYFGLLLVLSFCFDVAVGYGYMGFRLWFVGLALCCLGWFVLTFLLCLCVIMFSFVGLVFNVHGVLYAYLLVLLVCRGFLYFVVVGYAVVVCLGAECGRVVGCVC